MKNTSKRRVCVVIVTFNRKELLKEILLNFFSMTKKIDGLIIINNNSQDNTEADLISLEVIPNNYIEFDDIVNNSWQGINVYYYKSKTNMGGSGGFAKAFEIAESLDYDYIWAMDDDVLPDKNCLEKLLEYQDEICAVTIPNRYGEGWNEKATISYNLTNPFLYRIDDMKKTIYAKDIQDNYIEVVDMPLEGPLIRMDIARKVGIPDKNYFIMYDDTDFAQRLSKYTKIRFIKDAKLKRLLVSKEVKKDWDWKTYYLTRNAHIFDRKYGRNIFVKHLRPFIYFLSKIYAAIRDKKKYKYLVSRKAYHDFKHGNMGMVVKPGTDINEII